MIVITEKISIDPLLVSAIRDLIISNIEKAKIGSIWKTQLYCNTEIVNLSENLFEAVKRSIKLYIEKYLTAILYKLELETAF